MRARPREAQEGASTSLRPLEHMMWSMFVGECMEDHCHLPADVWLTTQLTWRSPTSAWTFCAGHAPSWINLFVYTKMYFLQIEAAGTFQPTLPLD